MAWTLIGKPKTVRVTKGLAREYAEMQPAPNDRKLSERRIEVYRQALEAGMFRPVSWAKCHCDETRLTYRINGKHTSKLLASLDVLPEFFVTIEEYRATSLHDISRL